MADQTGNRRKDSRSVLDNLTESESAIIFRALLKRHDSLRPEAEKLAAEMRSSRSVDDVADQVVDAITSLDADDLNERAGTHGGCYTEPTEAGWELLEEALEPFVSDLNRCVKSGLLDTAEVICRGIIVGLYKAKDHSSAGPLEWAPDFPVDEAGNVLDEYLKILSAKLRKQAHTRMLNFIAQKAPAWSAILK